MNYGIFVQLFRDLLDLYLLHFHALCFMLTLVVATRRDHEQPAFKCQKACVRTHILNRCECDFTDLKKTRLLIIGAFSASLILVYPILVIQAHEIILNLFRSSPFFTYVFPHGSASAQLGEILWADPLHKTYVKSGDDIETLAIVKKPAMSLIIPARSLNIYFYRRLQ